MNDFHGVVFPVHDPSERIAVELELLEGFVIMRAPENQWLGSWPVTQLRAAHVGGPRFRVSLRQAKLFIDVENPQEFLEALEDAVESVAKQSLWGRLSALTSRSVGGAKLSGRNESDSDSALTSKQAPTDPRDVASTLETPADFENERVVAHGVDVEVEPYQLEVVQWFEAGMTAWFEFYFELGSQKGRERLEQAAAGLEKAALQLRSLGEELGMLEINDEDSDLVLAYARSVGTWASALEEIAVGCRMDEPAWAVDGFTKMNVGTAAMEQILAGLPKVAPPEVVSAALSYLDALVPESKITNRSVLLAKEPWRRALFAAGWAHEKRSLIVAVWSTVLTFRNRVLGFFAT